jgi:hypothetical protein
MVRALLLSVLLAACSKPPAPTQILVQDCGASAAFTWRVESDGVTVVSVRPGDDARVCRLHFDNSPGRCIVTGSTGSEVAWRQTKTVLLIERVQAPVYDLVCGA